MTRAQIANMDQALFHYSSDLCTERLASEQAWQAIRPARNETSLGYLGLVMIQVTNWPCNKQGPYLRALKRNRVWIQRPLGKYPSIAPQFCLLGGDLPRCVMQRDWFATVLYDGLARMAAAAVVVTQARRGLSDLVDR